MVWGWDQKNHVSKWREGWLEQRRRVVVFVCNPNQREAGPSLNWEKTQRLKKAMKAEPVLWKESVCFANQQHLVISEPLGCLEAGRFELVLKGLEKNVKYMNTQYKKIPQMGSLMRFLVFPSFGQEEIPREGLQYFSTSVSVIQFLNEYRFSVSLCPTPFLPTEKETLGAERSGVQARLDWGVQSCWGRGGEPSSEGSEVSSAVYLWLSINHTGSNGKGPVQGVRKPVFQSWRGFSQAVWPWANLDFWVSVFLSVKWDWLTWMSSKLLFVSKMLRADSPPSALDIVVWTPDLSRGPIGASPPFETGMMNQGATGRHFSME